MLLGVFMNKVIDFKEKFTHLSNYWSPKIIAQFDDYHLKAAKMKGEFVWHAHNNSDELFIVISGTLTILLRDQEIILQPGQSFVVPKGIEHKPVAKEEVHVLFAEKAGTCNTGDTLSEKTVTQEEWI
jgi:mannose-6-phosphate isomerase-like protein (cupin superfamily)